MLLSTALNKVSDYASNRGVTKFFLFFSIPRTWHVLSLGLHGKEDLILHISHIKKLEVRKKKKKKSHGLQVPVKELFDSKGVTTNRLRTADLASDRSLN